MMTLPFQNNPDGSREFTCTGCGHRVYQAFSDGFDFPVCVICRWFDHRPQIPAHVRDGYTKARVEPPSWRDPVLSSLRRLRR